MNIYKYIINPETGKRVISNGKIGKITIRNYLKQFQTGGSHQDVDSEMPFAPIEMTSDQWTDVASKGPRDDVHSVQPIENKIVALSLEPDDMDRYITRQKDDKKAGKCFDEYWDYSANNVNWKVYNKVIPKEYTFEIKDCRGAIGKAQVYDNKLWIDYEDSNHSLIKNWLTENSEDLIQTYAKFKDSLFGEIFQKSYPKVFNCKH
jgi:hypothetical protein